MIILVPSERLELSRLSSLPPQDSVSTNSTTTAIFAGNHPLYCYYFNYSGTLFAVLDSEGEVPSTAGTSSAGVITEFVCTLTTLPPSSRWPAM
jgi:hypothetical protein